MELQASYDEVVQEMHGLELEREALLFQVDVLQDSLESVEELLAEAKLLRQHKGRLEARMQILEDHNKQLESQLHRLRQLLEQVTTAPPYAQYTIYIHYMSYHIYTYI